MVTSKPVQLVHLYVSDGHNFFGRHGMPPGEHATTERAEIRCVAGRGVEGDRFFDYRTDYRGQITFFAIETYEQLCSEFRTTKPTPAVFRRNVVTRGLDLRTLESSEFELDGVRFQGMGECKPCYWMDGAFGPGAERAMRGLGGLRAKILTTGVLRAGETDVKDVAAPLEMQRAFSAL